MAGWLRQSFFTGSVSFVVALAEPVAAHQEAPGPPRRYEATFVGLTFDTPHHGGKSFSETLGSTSGASSVGARLLRLDTGRSMAWFGYGVDARAITVGFDSFDAVMTQAVGCVGFGGPVGIQLEAALGVGIGKESVPFFALGGFIAVTQLMTFGIAGQVPIASERPHWLEEDQWGLRIVLPLDWCAAGYRSCGEAPQRSAGRFR